MNIIKEFLPHDGSATIIIRTRTYADTLAHFLTLFEVTRADFPTVEPQNVVVRHYGGERYKHTYGLEFEWPTTPESDRGYVQVDRLEYTL